MINPFREINWKPGTSEIRSFGRTVFIGFTVISALLACSGIFLRHMEHAAACKLPAILAACGAAVFILSLVSAGAAKPLYFIWFLTAACIGIVVSNLVLFIFYYLFFTPIAFAARIITGRDPLRLRKPDAASFWTVYRSRKSLRSYFKQY